MRQLNTILTQCNRILVPPAPVKLLSRLPVPITKQSRLNPLQTHLLRAVQSTRHFCRTILAPCGRSCSSCAVSIATLFSDVIKTDIPQRDRAGDWCTRRTCHSRRSAAGCACCCCARRTRCTSCTRCRPAYHSRTCRTHCTHRRGCPCCHNGPAGALSLLALPLRWSTVHREAKGQCRWGQERLPPPRCDGFR